MTRSSKSILIITAVIGLFFIYYNFFRKAHRQSISVEKKISMENWVSNSLHGFTFETPEALAKEPANLAEKNPEIKAVDVYLLKKPHLIVMFMFMDTRFSEYDLKKGLSGTIQNSLNVIGGHDLKLNFESPETGNDKLYATGDANLDGHDILVDGSIYWDKKGKIRILISMVNENEQNRKANQKIIRSGKLIDG